jgi:AmiR/NasT family two-component response regulator
VGSLRILLVGVPRLLADILRATPELGVRIVGEVAEVDALRAEVDRTRADVAVVATADPALPEAERWLREAGPALRAVVGITADGRKAAIHVLRPSRHPLEDLAPEEILRALRDVAQDGPA